MQISTYLYVSLNAVLAWKTLSHFCVKRWRPTDFSVFLLSSFRCNCHTHTKSYAEQLECTVITRTEFINRKTGLKKEVSHPRFLWAEAQGGGVLNFFPFLLWEFKARSWPLQRPLSHLLKIKPLIPALKIQIWEPSCLHTMECMS